METKILTNDEALLFCNQIELKDFTKIQPHGVLIVLNFDLSVAYYSENIELVLQTSIADLLSKSISDLLKTIKHGEIIDEYFNSTEKKYKQMIWAPPRKNNIQILVYIYRTENFIILEIEKDSQSGSNNAEMFNLAQLAINSINFAFNCDDLLSLAQQTCEEIKIITGYSRVIFYRFDKNDNSGLVIGEIVDDMDSYMGLHFPANDIPLSVRAMYLKEPLRYIPSSQELPVAVIPNPNLDVNPPLDMSLVTLRMVAPVHVKYLLNMKAYAAISVAIIENNQLWGLIACHHHEAKYLSTNIRLILLLISNTVAMQIMAFELKADYEMEQKTVALQSKLTATFGKENSLADAIKENHLDIMDIVSATGISYYFQDILLSYGDAPDNKQVMDLLKWLNTKDFPSVYSTSKLPIEYPNSQAYKNKACGLLAIKITTIEIHYILFYKPEQVHDIEWAGNPNQALKCSRETYSPRDSFLNFLQTITNQSAPWTKADEYSAYFIRSIITNRQLQDLLQVQAVHDPLTNLLNRLYLEQRLTLEIQRASRYSNQLAVIIADLDHFKKVNDQFGHQAGDAVLIEFAKQLKIQFRGYDYIYRYGGEEFLIILADIDTKSAVEKAENLRATIKNHKILFNELEINISVSLGVALYPEHGTDARELITSADLALYKAKQKGRDQVCLAKS